MPRREKRETAASDFESIFFFGCGIRALMKENSGWYDVNVWMKSQTVVQRGRDRVVTDRKYKGNDT